MNRNCKNSFDAIIGGASAYRSAVAKVLNTYGEKEQRAREDAALFKDEQTRYAEAVASLNATTQAQLAENRTAFCNEIASEVTNLKKELHSLALERPNPIYADMLRNYGDFGVAPTLTEIQALLEVNAGCLAGVSMLNSVLARVGSAFHIDGCDIATLEKDIENLSRLGELAEHYAPVENHSQLCKVYVGTPRLRDGKETGNSWDSISLIMARTAFESAVESIAAMAERWANLAPSISQIANYEDESEFISARESAAASITQQRDGVEQARNIGKAKAEAEAKNATVMDIYTR